MRNDLLADIVTASGGTITDRNNRNLLLKDWLDAVQAPAVNYVARLNGTDQYWQLSESIVIPSSVDFEMSLMAVRNGAAWGTLVGGDDFRVTAAAQTPYALLMTLTGGGQTLGRQFPLNSWPDSDQERSVKLIRSNGSLELYFDETPTGSPVAYPHEVSISRLAKDGVIGGNDYLNGYAKKLSVRIDGALTHEIPLTNKAQGATQLATVGSVNATMIGYSEDVWEQV